MSASSGPARARRSDPATRLPRLLARACWCDLAHDPADRRRPAPELCPAGRSAGPVRYSLRGQARCPHAPTWFPYSPWSPSEERSARRIAISWTHCFRLYLNFRSVAEGMIMGPLPAKEPGCWGFVVEPLAQHFGLSPRRLPLDDWKHHYVWNDYRSMQILTCQDRGRSSWNSSILGGRSLVPVWITTEVCSPG